MAAPGSCGWKLLQVALRSRWLRARRRARRCAARRRCRPGVTGRGCGRRPRRGRRARRWRARTPTRCRRAERMVRRMSARAPTSTACVGSCRTSTVGATESHLANSTFCWLPPDSSLVSVLTDCVWIESESIAFCAVVSCQRRPTNHDRPRRRRLGSAMLSRMLSSSASPSNSRFSGTSAMPAARQAGTSVFARLRCRVSVVSVPDVAGAPRSRARARVSKPVPGRPVNPTTSPRCTVNDSASRPGPRRFSMRATTGDGRLGRGPRDRVAASRRRPPGRACGVRCRAR